MASLTGCIYVLVCVCVYVTSVGIIVYCKVVAVCSFHIHLNSVNFHEMLQDDIVYKYNTIQYMGLKTQLLTLSARYVYLQFKIYS